MSTPRKIKGKMVALRDLQIGQHSETVDNSKHDNRKTKTGDNTGISVIGNKNQVSAESVVIENHAPKWLKRFLILIILSTLLLSAGIGFYPQYQVYIDQKSYQDIVLIVRQADSALVAGDHETALKLYRQASRYFPDDKVFSKKVNLMEQALDQADAGNKPGAEETFKMVLTLQPDQQLDVDVVDEETQVDPTPGAIPPLKVEIERLPGGLVEIRVTGGKPFRTGDVPYHIQGIDPKKVVKWRKDGEAYIARLENMNNEDILSIRVTDQTGKAEEQAIPPALAEDLFAMHRTIADDWFSKQQFARAKEAYQTALRYDPKHAHCKRRLAQCDQEIAWLKAKDIKMVPVEGGPAFLGSDNSEPDERPAHVVTLSSFRISKYEVTVKQYRQFCQATGRSMPPAPTWGWKDDHPIVNVSYHDAAAYCTWVGGRLPTEAEWEYAARGGQLSKSLPYAGSNAVDLNNAARYRENSPNQSTSPTGSLPLENELGLADMSGNVAEWCADWYKETYYQQIKHREKDPKGPLVGEDRVIRGGSWQGLAEFTTVSYRAGRLPETSENYIGFRVVKPPKDASNIPSS